MKPHRTVQLGIGASTKPEEEDADEIRKGVQGLYRKVPKVLRDSPAAQQECLRHLLQAETLLADNPHSRRRIVQARLALTRAEIVLEREGVRQRSFLVVVILAYFFAILVFLGFQAGIVQSSANAESLNKALVLGVPFPVCVWAAIGTLTSMLLRAGQFPFTSMNEAYRWLFFRPIVGLVMGVLTYLLVAAGLVILVGSPTTQTPELLWVLAFVGGFSDTLSVKLLERIGGQVKPAQVEDDHPIEAQGGNNKANRNA